MYEYYSWAYVTAYVTAFAYVMAYVTAYAYVTNTGTNIIRKYSLEEYSWVYGHIRFSICRRKQIWPYEYSYNEYHFSIFVLIHYS